MKKFTDQEAQEATLQELMDVMGKMDAGRVKPKAPAGGIPAGVLPPEGPGQDFGMGGAPAGADLSGLDPRLLEIIRNKQGR